MSSDSEDCIDWKDAGSDLEEVDFDKIGDIILDLNETGDGDSKVGEHMHQRKSKKQKLGPTRVLPLYISSDITLCHERHMTGLFYALDSVVSLIDLAKEDKLQCATISMLPPALALKHENINFSQRDVDEKIWFLREILSWFHQCFKLECSGDGHRDNLKSCEDKHSLLEVLDKTTSGPFLGTRTQLSTIGFCLLRTLGVQTRLVVAIDAPPYQAVNHRVIYEDAWRRGQAKASAGLLVESEFDSTEIMRKWDLKQRSRQQGVTYWLEAYVDPPMMNKSTAKLGIERRRMNENVIDDKVKIGDKDKPINLLDSDDENTMLNTKTPQLSNPALPFSESSLLSNENAEMPKSAAVHLGRWIHVDIITGLLDDPASVERIVRKKQIIQSYVVGIEDDRTCVDVSARYIGKPDKSQHFTTPELYRQWQSKLESISSSCFSTSIEASAVPAQLSMELDFAESNKEKYFPNHQRLQEEQKELAATQQKLPKPTTLSGYKSHPQYALDDERYLRADEMVKPGSKILGVFKGMRIVRRVDVEQIFSKKNWRRNMREVLEDEMETPVKLQHRTSRTADSSGNKEQYDISLYGKWQTNRLIVKPVIDGVIPTNEYGNVEIWEFNEALVPVGARLISSKNGANIPAIRTACTTLGLPYVDAVVGFDRSSGQIQPILGGVVVLQDYFDMLSDAGANVYQARNEEKERKKEKKIWRRWENLVKAVFVRISLKEKYGH